MSPSLLPPECDKEMTITSRARHWDDNYLQRVTLSWLLPPEVAIEMTITSRGWQWDDYYLQKVTLRWVLPPEGDINMNITSIISSDMIRVAELFYRLEYVSYLIWSYGRFTTYMSGATIIIKFASYHPLEVIFILMSPSGGNTHLNVTFWR
jgi:hypothetical protein